MQLLNNATLPAGTTRYLIPITSLEKRFNLSLYWQGAATAGTTARIMFADIWDDTNPNQALALTNARGITKPELFLDLSTSADSEYMWNIFPMYVRKAWLEITVVGSLTNVTAYVQPISNTER